MSEGAATRRRERGDGPGPGIHVHVAERADALLDGLAEVLARPPADPFATEVVAVPTRGVERWVAQRLSHTLGAGSGAQDGVCANVSFDPPSRLVESALAAVLGLRRQDDPWRRDRLAWAVLRVIDACAHEPWCAPLGRHLGFGTAAGPAEAATDRQDRRMQVAQHLAALFTGYGTQRPGLVQAWARDPSPAPDGDGTAAPLPPDLAWQPQLWRRVRALLGVPSPAERLAEAVEALERDPGVVPLPSRLSVFGATRLPADQLAVLTALGAHREVHLWLPHPFPPAVDGPATVATGRPTEPLPRRETVAPTVRHPLLASMARDALELQARLRPGAATTTHHPAARPPSGTVLGALQERLRTDDVASPPTPVPASDRSVQVHACHGRARQVEVLREVLLGLFADDPALEPRDVVVMCPDVETFAPLVAATFGLGGSEGGVGGPARADRPGARPVIPRETGHPGSSLRVSLADRSLRQSNPVLGVLAALLELADSRVTASAVLDLAGAPPVRARFGWKDDDLEQLRAWCVAAGVRWGEDEGRRRRYGLSGLGQGTWRAATSRLLLGVAMADEDDRFVGPVIPLDDVDSSRVDLAGRFCEFVDRMSAVLASLDGRHPAAAWFDTLDAAVDLLTAAPAGQSWQEVEARAVLADARRAAQDDTLDRVELSLADLRAVLGPRLRGRPTRAGFRTGALTVCSLEPMRSVPHRVVCLLGLDDGAFPRGRGVDGDDVLQRDPLIGERDRRLEDRQLFLDAVTSAADHLVVLYSGADERTGARRPPAVPVSELLDALDAAVTVEGRPAREHVVTRHPLQTFDPRNFEAGALGRPGPFSFDRLAHAAAGAARRPRSSAPAFLTAPLPPPGPEPGDAAPADTAVPLVQLLRTLEHPVRELVRGRLGASLPRDEDDVQDRLPLELTGLEGWQVGDRLLAAALAGTEPTTALAAERRRGLVPPGALGSATLARVGAGVDPVARAVAPWREGDAEVVDVALDLGGGPGPVTEVHRLTGTVSGLHVVRTARGEENVLVRAEYSKLGPKHRLRAWVQLLAVAASRPDDRFRAVTIGRGPGRRPSAVRSELEAPSADEARARLADLAALFDLAHREPLPMLPAVSAAYVTARLGGDDEPAALAAARALFDSGYETDEYHDLVWGEGVTFETVLGTPTDGESRAFPGTGTRFGVLARRVWEPLLEHEIRGVG